MWTERVRSRAVGALPPEKLLPDRQPAYVSSWIYVFGVATIAALIVVIGSGMILGLKGPAWWHESGVGKFFNSVHLWGVEIFFFTMVVHLWGKFFMGAWRGGRSWVWVTGAVAFPGLDRHRVHRLPLPAELRLAVDRQRREGRSQLGWDRRLLQRHRLRPDVHLARDPAAGRRGGDRRGSRAPGPQARRGAALRGEGCRRAGGRGDRVSPRKPKPAPLESKDWEGPYIRYDLVKEFVVALAVIVALVVVLAILFSSPDDKPVTIQQWARTDPGGFVATAVTELDGSSEVATYGAPYTHTPDTGQKIGPLNLQSAAGVHYSDQHRRGLRAEPAAQHSRRRGSDQGAPGVPGGAPGAAEGLDRRVHEGPRRRHVPRRDPPACRPATTGRSPR